MFIAAMTEEPGEDGIIAPSFSSAGYLQIFDTELGRCAVTYPRGETSDLDLAERIVEHDCEALICGPIEPGPFEVIADRGCVTRYLGSGLRLDEALRRMEAYGLELITDFIGGTGCGSGEGAECGDRHDDSDDDPRGGEV